MKSKILLLTASLVFAFSARAHAAFITIDDSDLNFITITAGDFEAGLYVNGNLLTTGLSASNSITLADGGYIFSGSWIDLGLSSGSQNLYFADAGAPTGVTSGMEMTASTNGNFGSFSGSFGGYTGIAYFTGSPTSLQGTTQNGSYPYLSYSFISERGASVPDSGASVAMLGGVLVGLVAFRRKFVK